MKILVTRPRADAQHFAEALVRLGHEPLFEPMLEILFRPGPPLGPAGYQAVLLTSVNGVRALTARNGGSAGALSPLPAYAVGDATAAAARAAGFATVVSAAGDATALAGLVTARLSPPGGALLHVAGSEVAGDLAGRLSAAGFAVERAAIYQARHASELSTATRDAFSRGAVEVATFFSPRTMRAFVTLVRQAALGAALTSVSGLCLSRAVAEASEGVAWRALIVASRPDQDAMLQSLATFAASRVGGSAPDRSSASSVTPASRKSP